MTDAQWIDMRYVLIACSLALASPAHAECDAFDERVAIAAREALRTGDFTRVAVWVDGAHEQALRAAFRRAQEVRMRAAFVATAQRLHHETDPTPCTPMLPIADAALASGDSDAIVEAIVARVRLGLHERLREVGEHRVRRGDVDGGRAAAARTIDFVRYAAAIYAAATTPQVQIDGPLRYEE